MNWIEADEYDPENALWKPGRRSFMFLCGAAIGSLFVPGGVQPAEWFIPNHLVTPEWVIRETAEHFMRQVAGVQMLNRTYDEAFGGLVK